MSQTSKPNLKLGYDQYILYPDDGNRHELIDGDHYMSPAPSTYHQAISKRLQHQLYTKVELARLGSVFNAPIDVQLSEHDIVQPDLIALMNDSAASVAPAKVKGPPDLVIEILSPSTAKNDLDLKRRTYQRFGVREYWIVDPDQQSILQLQLVNDVFVEQPAASDAIRLAIIPEVEITLADVWQ